MTISPASDFSPWNVTVREICQTLGWGGDPGTPRHFKSLSLQVSKFRKRFTGKEDFPIDSNSEKARRCASEFCDQDLRRKEFFIPSNEANRPSLPNDRQMIEEGLTKLLCLQEYYQRRNDENKAKRGTKKGKGKGRANKNDEDDDEEDDDDEYNYEDDESEEEPTDNEPGQDDDFVPRLRQMSKAGSSIIVTARLRKSNENIATNDSKIKKEREEQNEEAVRYNIDQHLNYVYSLSQSPSLAYQPLLGENEEPTLTDPNVRWLFETNTSGDWPEQYKILAWRFMHGNNLYTLAPAIEELNKIGGLVTYLTKHLHVKVDATHHAVIFEKVKKFVIYSTRKFMRDYGLLEQLENCPITRIAPFSASYFDQLEKWKKTIKLNLSPNQRLTPPNPNPDPTSVAPIGSHKRTNSSQNNPLETSTDDANIDSYTDFIAKRQRTTMESTITYRTMPSRTLAEPEAHASGPRNDSDGHPFLKGALPQLHKPNYPNDNNPSPPRHNRLGAMSSSSTPPRLLPGFRSQERHMAANSSTIEVAMPNDRPRGREPNPNPNPSINKPPSRGGSPYLHHTLPRMRDYSPHQLNRQSSTSSFNHHRQLSRQSSNSSIGLTDPLNDFNLGGSPYLRPTPGPSSVATHDSEVSHLSESMEPTDITFILHNKFGILDFDNPVPFHVFRNTTISAFFTLYSQRSGIQLEYLEKLTFTVVFAKHLTFYMRRDGDELEWRRFKKRVGSLFLLTKERRPNETDFEVWVDAGEESEVDHD